MNATNPGSGKRPVHVCGHHLPKSAHICAFFDSEAEQYECLGPYFAEGLDNGELLFAIRDADGCAHHIAGLESAMRRSLAPAFEAGQFRLMSTEDTYLADRAFDDDRMHDALVEILRQASRDGFARVRTCGDMNWALRLEDINSLMRYEARVNQLTKLHDCTFMCMYDLNRFSGRVIMDVLSTHPFVLINNCVRENPYYVEPEQFLEALARRGATEIARSN